MAKLWRNIKDTVPFATAANAPIDPNLIADAALIAINRTQAYKQAYLAYKQLPVQNCLILRAHFEQAERDRREVEDEVGAHGYGMNAMEAADHAYQKGLTDIAAVLTHLSKNEAANAGYAVTADPAPDAEMTTTRTAMAQQQQTIANLQIQMAAAAQQRPPPATPYCAPTTQQLPTMQPPPIPTAIATTAGADERPMGAPQKWKTTQSQQEV